MAGSGSKDGGSHAYNDKALGRKSSGELFAMLAQAFRDNGEHGFFEFTIWAHGEVVRVGAYEGSMVTINDGDRVLGIYPHMPTKRSRQVSVSLLELKSARHSPDKGKVLQRVKASPGKRVGFEDHGIYFEVARSVMPKPKKPAKSQCCVDVDGHQFCASCFVYWDGKRWCCNGLICCIILIFGAGRATLTPA